MGIETVAVYSDADKHAPHVREADPRPPPIGPSPARESYLDVAKVLAAAKASGGGRYPPRLRLSVGERRLRARPCCDAGLTWVGPPPGVHRSAPWG